MKFTQHAHTDTHTAHSQNVGVGGQLGGGGAPLQPAARAVHHALRSQHRARAVPGARAARAAFPRRPEPPQPEEQRGEEQRRRELGETDDAMFSPGERLSIPTRHSSGHIAQGLLGARETKSSRFS